MFLVWTGPEDARGPGGYNLHPNKREVGFLHQGAEIITSSLTVFCCFGQDLKMPGGQVDVNLHPTLEGGSVKHQDCDIII
jgi:hypothetical protein